MIEWALGEYEERVQDTLRDLAARRVAARIWGRDGSLWTADPAQQARIGGALGWLDVIGPMQERAGELAEFAEEVRQAGFTHALLLGMGGSSLAPELFATAFGSAPGFLWLGVLDTTDPSAIVTAEQLTDPYRPLYIVSSKSGTTPEVQALAAYFWGRACARGEEWVGERFIAITDPGTPLEALARERQYRRVFLNPPDIGGRYSALSLFGLVPAALLGVDLPELLGRAEAMAMACAPAAGPPQENPGLVLGTVLGSLALAGRDKLTTLCPPDLRPFACWLEQLIAESTGKDGRGILPVEGEPGGSPAEYGNDRVFVAMRLQAAKAPELDDQARALEDAGHPVVRLRLEDLHELGGEFFRWEFATAAAGAILEVNPFDQPDVQASQENTTRLLDRYQAEGVLPEGEPIFAAEGIRLYGDGVAAAALRGARRLGEALRAHLQRVKPGEYIALTAYLPWSLAPDGIFREMRGALRRRWRVATTLGYGPRFLHSTGQLHKGGGDRGVFLQITMEDRPDLAIPGTPHTFGVMKRAQALGDLQALQARGRRALRAHITGDVTEGLLRLLQAVRDAG